MKPKDFGQPDGVDSPARAFANTPQSSPGRQKPQGVPHPRRLAPEGQMKMFLKVGVWDIKLKTHENKTMTSSVQVVGKQEWPCTDFHSRASIVIMPRAHWNIQVRELALIAQSSFFGQLVQRFLTSLRWTAGLQQRTFWIINMGQPLKAFKIWVWGLKIKLIQFQSKDLFENFGLEKIPQFPGMFGSCISRSQAFS